MINNNEHAEFDKYSANLVKRLRKENNMSMDELSRLTNLSKSTISRYEKNGLSNAPMDKIEKLASAFGVSISYLCGWGSRELSSTYYENLLPLLQELGYELEYEYTTESFSLKSDVATLSLSIEQLKNLKDTTYSFLKFKLHELANTELST